MVQFLVLLFHVTMLINSNSATLSDPSPNANCKSVQSSSPLSHEALLLQNLLCRQNKVLGIPVRPVVDSSEPVQVQFTMTLYAILSVDAKSEVLTTKVWRKMIWTDEYMVWDPKDFGNLTTAVLPANHLWLPDIILYNNGGSIEDQPGDALINANGAVIWVPPITYTSTCAINMKYFPFDQQNCTFAFGSWVYDDSQIKIDFYNQISDVDLSSYVDSPEWILVATGANKTVYAFEGGLSYTQLNFYVVIKRKPGFYIYVLIAPSLLLSALTPALFWIPPSRPDRTTLAMSLFSSYFVMLLVLVQLFPTSATESRLAIYYCFSMALITSSTLFSTLVIYISNVSHRHPVPNLVSKILIQYLGKLLQITSPKVNSVEDFNYTQQRIESNKPRSSAAAAAAATRVNEADGHNTDAYLSNTAELAQYLGEQKSSIHSDWKILVIVLDRIFFMLSTLATTVAIVALCPCTHLP